MRYLKAIVFFWRLRKREDKHLGAALLGAGPKNLVYVGGCLPSFLATIYIRLLSHVLDELTIFFLLFCL